MALAGCGSTDSISIEAAESYDDEAAPMNGGDAGISVFSGPRGEAERLRAEDRRLALQREAARRRAKGDAVRAATLDRLTMRGTEDPRAANVRHANAECRHLSAIQVRSSCAWVANLPSANWASRVRDDRAARAEAARQRQAYLWEQEICRLQDAEQRSQGDAPYGRPSSHGTAQERPLTADKTKEEITAQRRARGRALLEARKIGDLATEETILAEAEAIRSAWPDLLPHLNTPNGTRYHEGAVARSVEGSVRVLSARRADTEAPSYNEIDARPATGIPSIVRHDVEDAIVREARWHVAFPVATPSQHDETPVCGTTYFDRLAASDFDVLEQLDEALRDFDFDETAAEDADDENE